MSAGQTPLWLRRTVVAGLLGGLLLVGFIVMRPFLVALAWAAILTYVSWPLLLRVQAWLGGRRTWAALGMTALLTLALGGVLLWMGLLLRGELTAAVREATALLQTGVRLPEPMLRIPWLGPWLQERLLELGTDRAAWGRQMAELAEQWGIDAMSVVGDLGLNALRFGVTLLTSFFLFRDGDRLLAQLRGVLHGLLGERVQDYFAAVGDTTRAVVYGLLLAAITQGLLAGLGYWAAGVKAPAFWGATTALVALIPFGAPLIWGSIGVWLLLQGQAGAGIGLLLWGALAVSWIDNLVRPWVISGVAKIPFLLVLFGVLGGLAAFGLIGLFVGPVILAVLLALWREWAAPTLDEHPPRT
ncbi:MAG: AI-2E family transporter [Burkholderiales bacterium]|nr:AI-2E family transporter [Burkholderiales bacterium]